MNLDDSNTDLDIVFMTRALQLAEFGTWSTMPNPRVGCVITYQNQIIGEGWHARAGDAHAEIIALENAKRRFPQGVPKPITVYVTLEPCAHQGKTGACAQALIDHGVYRVVAAMKDPNPAVNGLGFAMLQKAGIQVEQGLLAMEAAQLNLGFLRRSQGGVPWVRCKLAISLDGRTAMKSGESRWITGPKARQDVQQWRARSCAIITGVNTIINDNPMLTVRPKELDLERPSLAAEKQPTRIILDSYLRTPDNAQIITTEGRLVVLTTHHAESKKIKLLRHSGVEVVELVAEYDNGSHRIGWHEILAWASEQQFNEVLIESGATVAGSAVKAGVIDELIVYMAPILMGKQGYPLFDLSIDSMSEVQSLRLVDQQKFGDDLRMRFHFNVEPEKFNE